MRKLICLFALSLVPITSLYAHFWSCQRLPPKNGYGYTWTLTTRIGQMLEDAEKLFGKRDESWTILGCQYYRDKGSPNNWFPGYPKVKHIVFNLSARADTDMNIALYQLSHEVIHSLAPKVGGNAKVIEEGTAMWFAIYYVQKECKVDTSSWASEDYKRAYAAVKKLLDKDKEAILKLRKIEPVFDNMTRETFVKAKINISDRDINFLLMSHNALNKLIEKEKTEKVAEKPAAKPAKKSAR